MGAMTYKTRTLVFWFSILLFLAVSPPVLFYATGWRITPGFKIERTGGLFIAVPESGSRVYLNNEFRAETGFFSSGVLLQNLTPHHYSVLVAKDGFWPWTKTLPVKGSEVVEARALMIPHTVSAEPVNAKSADYKTALAAINALKRSIRTATSTATARFGLAQDERGRAQTWFDAEGRVWIEWLSDSPLPFYLDAPKKPVFQSRSAIHGISFLPGRNDIVTLATENGVFALEIDGRGTQNFQPIYKGADPYFARIGDALYILDSNTLARISL